MMIYAVFACLPIGCHFQPVVGSHIEYRSGEPIGVTEYFDSKSECERVLTQQLGPHAGDPNSGGAFYRCLGKNIEAWR